MFSVNLPWHEPLAYADQVNARGGDFVFLYSSLTLDFTGRYSFLAFHPIERIISEDFASFERVLSTGYNKFTNAWFGYLGYGLKHAIEDLPHDQPSFINLPPLWMTHFQIILEFDHELKKCTAWMLHKEDEQHIIVPEKDFVEPKSCSIQSIESNMTKSEYLAGVEEILRAIAVGDVYQANLTRKFFGAVNEQCNPFHLFAKLTQVSPAPYSSFLKLGENSIISSTPERFINIDASGKAQARPIKGSAPRYDDPEEDKQAREALAASAKDKAENLMIVDLMRNDFARSAKPGSVKVKDLFSVTSYSTVHHMASTVEAIRREELSPLHFIKGCFPPGSMTGAPKIKAMEVCSNIEKQERGVYSGAIGWFAGDGYVDLSVVIRTLILQGNRFEFQVGGGIVADSTPEGEWYETLVKARGIGQALGFDPHKDLLF